MLEDRTRARANMASAVVDEIAVDASEGRPGSTTSRGSGRTGSTPSSSARSGARSGRNLGFIRRVSSSSAVEEDAVKVR